MKEGPTEEELFDAGYRSSDLDFLPTVSEEVMQRHFFSPGMFVPCFCFIVSRPGLQLSVTPYSLPFWRRASYCTVQPTCTALVSKTGRFQLSPYGQTLFSLWCRCEGVN